MNQQKIDILICKNVKTVGCEFSKYVQLLESRQKKIRRYREEDIKPLITVITSPEQTLFEETEKLIKNSKYKYWKLVQVPARNKWQIIDTRTNRFCHENDWQQVYQTIKEIIEEDKT